jgi:hypothetical protein
MQEATSCRKFRSSILGYYQGIDKRKIGRGPVASFKGLVWRSK